MALLEQNISLSPLPSYVTFLSYKTKAIGTDLLNKSI